MINLRSAPADECRRLVDRDPFPTFLHAIGPDDDDGDILVVVAQTEVHTDIAGAQVTTARAYLAPECPPIFQDDTDLRANAVTVAAIVP